MKSKKKITQSQIANWVGVSPMFISLFRKGGRLFSKHKALELSKSTGVSFELLTFTGGTEGYQALVDAFAQQKENET